MREYGTITMFRGGDANFRLYFPGAEGEPLDLTGYTVEAFEPHPLLEDNLDFVIEEPEEGCVIGSIYWSPEYKIGSTMTFYIRLIDGDMMVSAPKMVVKVV